MRRFLVSLVNLVLLVLLVLAGGCARQGYPTGGPKDEEPPVALGTKPANESRHFADNEFYIQFDEYVVLKNAAENVLVSPPMKQKPEYSTKGKGVLVKLNDTLLPNTTYLFQFKEAIADFTEGNLLPSFEYVFSTGADLDTMSLSGHVLDARSGKPWKETVTVMAYKDPESDVVALDDTIATFVQPDFVTRCDKEGHFAFHFIPVGKYRLVALEDKNRNLRVDVADAVAWDTALFEAHPVPDSTQALTQALTQSGNQAITLFISQPDNTQQRITKSEFTEPGRVVIVTSRPMRHPMLTGDKGYFILNSTNDTLTLWCQNPACDSLRLIIDDDFLHDTLSLRYTKKTQGSRRKLGAKEEKKAPLVQALCDGNKAFYDDLRLAFTNPVDPGLTKDATAEIMNLKDSTVGHCRIVPVQEHLQLQVRLDTTLKSGEKYHVRIKDSLFSDLYGNFSDSLSFDLTPKDYGTLSISIDNKTGFPLVIEVLDKRDTIVQRSSLNTQHSSLRFSHLPAGDYRLRAIIDRNRDGRWTPGDYRQQRQPEQAVMFEKTLSLREKWEMEEHWTVKKETSMKEHQIKAIPFMPEKDRKGSLKPIKEP